MNKLKIPKLTIKETALLMTSAFVLIISFVISKSNILYLIASLVGLVALMYMAKGEPLGQILTILFSILYAVISYRFRYYGEMITYLFMTLPSALIATIVWYKNPYSNQGTVVKVSKLSSIKIMLIIVLTPVVTILFYYILKALSTPNLFISTVSIATSFLASILTFFRSRHYAFFYAMNDIVLITLRTLATMTSLAFFPMIICFVFFFIHDLYAFFNWKKLELQQQTSN